MKGLHIDRYLQEDGYHHPNGFEVDTAFDFYVHGEFKFCGCGFPEQNLAYIRDGLEHINKFNDHRENYGYKDWYTDWFKEAVTLHGTQESVYFFFYWADSQDLTEHGAGLPGWLTTKGRETLEDLRVICELEDPSNEVPA